MAHPITSITPVPATSALIPTGSRNNNLVPSSVNQFQRVWARNGASVQTTDNELINRRTALLGLGGALLGLSVGGDRSANAAGRRPPPPPPREKQDPNLSGVQARVLASKKRKEALKETVAKLREKGKPVEETKPPQ